MVKRGAHEVVIVNILSFLEGEANPLTFAPELVPDIRG